MDRGLITLFFFVKTSCKYVRANYVQVYVTQGSASRRRLGVWTVGITT